MTWVNNEFIWFTGVVEDRNDPLMLGRVRVRCLGYHSADKNEIPTDTLPWAHPLAPITSASMSGIGQTPIGLVEGTWVVGFFQDGKEAQMPVIMGSIGGIPEKFSDKNIGFNDPNGRYPLKTAEPDTNRLARSSENENAESIVEKRLGRIQPSEEEQSRGIDYKIPKATAPKLSTIADSSTTTHYDREAWNEPNPKYGGQIEGNYDTNNKTVYPFNHVRMSESGHVEEWDDTPGSERLHKQHTSGTFEEIQASGDKITKVVGDEYEINIQNKNVYINGSCNVTITGDAKMLYQGDLVQEVQGSYFLNVRGDMVTKVQGSQATEIITDRTVNINKNDNLRVGVDKSETTLGNFVEQIGKDHKETVVGNNISFVAKNDSNVVGGNKTIAASGTIDIGADGNLSLAGTGRMNLESTGDMELTAPRIDLNK